MLKKKLNHNLSLKGPSNPVETSQNLFLIEDLSQKLKLLPEAIESSMKGQALLIPHTPGRSPEVRAVRELPDKPGLSRPEGVGRLMHDLASIELQAMELALRTLYEFPVAPEEFRQQLAQITLDEGRHLGLCLKAIEDLGFHWGSWPVHLALWGSVSTQDTLLDRILIVHRYLEGSGLDAGAILLRRLSGVSAASAKEAMQVIHDEELAHVEFGSRWYRKICQKEGLDPGDDFGPRLRSVVNRVPRRLEKLDRRLRIKAGFTEDELLQIENLRQMWLN